MRFDIMTLFPELVTTVLGESIIGRAQQSGAITVRAHNIRTYSQDKHHRVDDTPYGGGRGMLMMAPPIYDCYADVVRQADAEAGAPMRRRVVFMSPKGKILTQQKAAELAAYDHLVILCGHYEGVDQRVIDEIIDEEISIGNYVLTGGEIPACILVDCVARMIPGVLADEACYESESIACGMLEYPQYTRPFTFHGVDVPEVLISGHHANIEAWRGEQARALTRKMRPDLLAGDEDETDGKEGKP